jgi:DNA-binding NarL/FixJ family response regulator
MLPLRRTEEDMRILIADDHPMMLAALRDVLEATGEFEVVAEARSGPEVLPLIGRTSPDMVLLDLRMPGLDGLACMDRIAAHYPKTKMVVLSATSDPELIQAAFRHGACGYVVKGIDIRDLASAIRQAIHGTAYHALGLPALDEQSTAKAAGLSERELTILVGVTRGLASRTIAKELWVTEQTIKFHLSNIYRKLGVANRTEAARWAFVHGLLTDVEPAGAVATNETTRHDRPTTSRC